MYAAAAAAFFRNQENPFDEILDEKQLDFPNALMYDFGHGRIEVILLGGLANISTLRSILMINSGAMQNALVTLPAESASQMLLQLSSLY